MKKLSDILLMLAVIAASMLFCLICLQSYEKELALKDAYIEREYIKPQAYCDEHDCNGLSQDEITAIANNEQYEHHFGTPADNQQTAE